MRKKKQKSDNFRIFFTSDMWFGRNNIIDIYKRPFKNADEMDMIITERWNTTVGDDDLVFILGNAAYNSAILQNTFTELKGTKILMMTESDKTVFRIDDSFVEELTMLKEIYEDEISTNTRALYKNLEFLTSDEIFDAVVKISDTFHPNLIILKESIIDLARYGIVMSLYPLLDWNGKSSGTLNIHGGMLESSKDFNVDNRLSVRTDFWDFRPIALDEIQMLVSQLKTN